MASRKCDTYEEVATYLLNLFKTDFGLDRVEAKQEVPGQESGTSWEIDAKGVRESDGGIMIVECRRHTKSKATQEQLAAVAYRIFDIGAFGGIYVSPLGFQKGAKKVAAAENIISVTLTPESTPHDFEIGLLDKFRIAKGMTMHISGKAPDDADAPRTTEPTND